jgi:hypothetical protein
VGFIKASFLKIIGLFAGLSALVFAPVTACSTPPEVPVTEVTMSVSVTRNVNETAVAAFALG